MTPARPAAGASSCTWLDRSIDRNHQAAASTESPTVSSPWLRSTSAFRDPSAAAIRRPPSASPAPAAARPPPPRAPGRRGDPAALVGVDGDPCVGLVQRVVLVEGAALL